MDASGCRGNFVPFLPSGGLWRHAGFVKLWSAQAISTFGARIARTALPLAALMTTHATPAQLGLLAALTTAPAVLVGLSFRGRLDRRPRRRLMIEADLVRAVVLLAVPALAWMRVLNMNELYIAAALVGGSSALFDIADHAFLPDLVGKPDLMEANAKLSVTESVSEIGGPALAGVLVQLLTAPFAIGFNALSYLASALLLSGIEDRESQPRERRGEGRDAESTSALNAILSNPLIRPLFLMAILSPLFEGFFAALYSYFAINVLHLSAALLGAIIGVGGIGALLGASASPLVSRMVGIGPTIVFGYFLSAVSAFSIPLASGSVVFATSMLIAGQLFGDGLALVAMVPATSLRQSALSRSLLGRTAALFRAGSGASTVLGALAGGFAGNFFGVRAALFVSAAGITAVSLIGVASPLSRLRSLPEAAA